MSFSSALQQLQQQLRSVTGTQRGFLCLSVPLADESDSLAWLAEQPVWPKFFWQQREGRQQLMALGEVRRAETLSQAATLLASLPVEGCLVGANAFSCDQRYLFLPRLLWRGNRLTVFLYGVLQEEAHTALRLITQLRPAAPLPELPRHILSCQHCPDSNDWQRQIAAALLAITNGILEKVVMARATDLHFSQALSALSLLAASRKVNHGCYHYLLSLDRRQTFIGSSPERLFHRQGRMLRSEALAGSCANVCDDTRAQTLADRLLQDDKSRRENRLVIKDICQRLRPLVDKVAVGPAVVVRLRKVQHLRCDILGELNKTDDISLIKRLQPTAAVAGLPRQLARTFIQQHEPFPRGWYAGSVGWLSASESEFNVALRCALVEENKLRLYAGAGIVTGSDARAEWQELNDKASGLAGLLGEEIVSQSCFKSS